MARKIPLTSLRSISEINLTPLMDLTFILLITFIITFPLIEQGIPVNLPKGKAKDLSAETAQTITIDREGSVYLNDLLTVQQDLKQTIHRMGQTDPNVHVMIRADERVRYASVVNVLKMLHAAGITRTALVTRGDDVAEEP